MTGSPAENRWRGLAFGDLVLTAFNTLEDLERSIRAHGNAIDSLELVGDSENLADDLHRGAGAT